MNFLRCCLAFCVKMLIFLRILIQYILFNWDLCLLLAVFYVCVYVCMLLPSAYWTMMMMTVALWRIWSKNFWWGIIPPSVPSLFPPLLPLSSYPSPLRTFGAPCLPLKSSYGFCGSTVSSHSGSGQSPCQAHFNEFPGENKAFQGINFLFFNRRICEILSFSVRPSGSANVYVREGDASLSFPSGSITGWW